MAEETDFDVCIIGSGAGAGPVAYTLAMAGYRVAVLEKGPWLGNQDFVKDEVSCCIKPVHIPDRSREFHELELETNQGGWRHTTTRSGDWNLWNGNVIGGASNFMSGYFHRMKPLDFTQQSELPPIDKANIVDWPIEYQDLEPYYTRVEQVIGVSGQVRQHPFAEPRSQPNFPFPPTAEHALARHIDEAAQALGLHPLITPRAILPHDYQQRKACSYSGYCGSYGCHTGAKGSSRVALLEQAVASGNCRIFANTHVSHLTTSVKGKITHLNYINARAEPGKLNAKIYVVACQAVETARLLLNSSGPRFPHGLSNNHAQVGKNLLFAGGGAGSGVMMYEDFPPHTAEQLKLHPGAFINRSLQDWYVITDREFGAPQKGGTIDFVHLHPNPIARARRKIHNQTGLVWGTALQQRLFEHFNHGRFVKMEAFTDWVPHDDCFVTLSRRHRDNRGLPVASVRIAMHIQNIRTGWYLASQGARVLKQMGAKNVVYFAASQPPTNLMAGGCRFGKDPLTSVLDSDCRSHEVDNLFISDGSFMPTGGSVPYTWTIYANAFRVADKIIAQLGGAQT